MIKFSLYSGAVRLSLICLVILIFFLEVFDFFFFFSDFFNEGTLFYFIQYLKNEMRHEVDCLYVSDNSIGLGLALMFNLILLRNDKRSLLERQERRSSIL